VSDIFDVDAPQAGGNAPPLTVSEISGAVKRTLEGAFGRVRVRGEVGRVSRPRSGHLYFDLKDDRAVLAAVAWKGQAARLEVQPEEGDEVVAEGRLTTFPGQSKYQLIVDRLSYAGAGALLAKLERLKAALAAEGLFAPERKRRPPFLPRVVGVVTSPSGAVIRDILHRLSERFPCRVLVWPVAVQGAACVPEVAAALRGFNALTPGGAVPRPDVLIVARGGGSVEDLWGFNEEAVVRAIADSAIPVISAVGHETDTTLADFAADLRAPTPTAAAEFAAPVRAELQAAVATLQARRARSFARMFEDRRRRLRDLGRLLPGADALLAGPRQRLDRVADALPRALRGLAGRKRAAMLDSPAGRFAPALLRPLRRAARERLARAGAALAPRLRARLSARRQALDDRAARLTPVKARAAARRGAERLAGLSARMDRAAAQHAARRRQALGAAGAMLETLGHKATLARGFALVRGADGAPLKRAADVAPGAGLSLEFADGQVAAQAAGRPAPAPRRRGGGGDQGSLF
jgi:exodeoxyribonuclease VII large subunit